jgi:hypothetical protein
MFKPAISELPLNDGVVQQSAIARAMTKSAVMIQKRLVETAVRLLASCSNTVIHPKSTLENAKRKSHLHFTFIEPRSFDLGMEKRPGTTGVQVEEIVTTLPLSSGGAWIDSTKFRFYCSKFDTKITQEMEEILKSVQTP